MIIEPDTDYCYSCGYQVAWLDPDSVIKFQRVLFHQTNTESALNITTGLFTARRGGVWRVEWSMVTEPEDEEEDNIFLARNGEKVPELSHYAVHVGSEGWSAATGGRSVFLRLDDGDELSLVTDRCDGGVYGVLLCFSLLHPGL